MPLKNYLVFNATYSAGWVTVITSFGLKVKFDGNHRVYVYVNSKYRGQLTGLCGDCNGKKDDFRTKEGIDVSTKTNKYSLIGMSYQVPDDSDKPENVCNVTDITTNCHANTTRRCELMTDESGIFGGCIKKLGIEAARQHFESCKIDVCAYSTTTKHKTSATCKSFESFVEECEEKGVLVNWRGVLGCNLDCSTWANTMYKFNVTNNQPTCMNRNPTPTAYLTDGCVCKGSYVLSGKECVPKPQCGCMYGGMYLQVNTTILSSDCSESITCLGNGRINQTCSCPKGSDCLIEFGERMCKCPESYAPLNGECKGKLKDIIMIFITYLIDCVIGV
ncbi:zonadhesin [Octopus bimaculoides]|uniref:zonadhesin n=1 Tax=Octopus bimaculoides TaxID=37653 RepID=UPI00071E5EF6|nr:zonadhesin [Octopus bimaculoides]|eukprot:XP_014768820.1 PREDICTED: zonadhesin-like [Octopus bimaculoides]